MELTLKERKKLTRLTARKYQKAARREKTAILNIIILQTVYERKYAIHLLANEDKKLLEQNTARLVAAHRKSLKCIYEKYYAAEVLNALVAIWEAFNYQCGKLLASFLHANIESIAAKPKFAFSDTIRLKLGRISAATIDRLLRKKKAQMHVKGTSGTKACEAYQVPYSGHEPF